MSILLMVASVFAGACSGEVKNVTHELDEMLASVGACLLKTYERQAGKACESLYFAFVSLQ